MPRQAGRLTQNASSSQPVTKSPVEETTSVAALHDIRIATPAAQAGCLKKKMSVEESKAAPGDRPKPYHVMPVQPRRSEGAGSGVGAYVWFNSRSVGAIVLCVRGGGDSDGLVWASETGPLSMKRVS